MYGIYGAGGREAVTPWPCRRQEGGPREGGHLGRDVEVVVGVLRRRERVRPTGRGLVFRKRERESECDKEREIKREREREREPV